MAVDRAMSAARRRVIFGVNAMIQAVLATVLVIGVVWLAARFKGQFDASSSGVNSLSPRTQQLLRNLKQDLRITGVFVEPDKRDEVSQKRRREIRDLLELYETAGRGHVTTALLDPSLQKPETDKLLRRLADLPGYHEAKPHEEALTKFPPVNEKIRALATAEAQRADALAQTTAALAKDRNFAIVRNNWRSVEREAQRIVADLDELKKGEIPRYGQAIQKVRDYLNTAQLMLRDAQAWMTGEALAIPNLTPEAQAFFQEAPGRYEAALAEITSLIDATKDLKDVKLEEAYNELTRWRSSPPVLVESPTEARVVSFWDIWPMPTDQQAPRGRGGDDREFAGESALSSAILQLTQAEKTAVIFTRYGGQSFIKPDFSQMNMMMMQQLPRAPAQELARVLEKGNFVVEDWDVAKNKTPPEAKGAARRIYVVLPPEPPPRPNPMQPSPQPGMTPEDRQRVLDAVDASGMAIFLAGWTPPQSPFPGATGSYEYADYLKKNWGIDGQYNFLTLEFTPHPEKPGWWVPAGRDPWLLTTDTVVRMTDHPIAKPAQVDRAAFFQAAPLKILSGNERPAGLQVEPLAEVRETQDVWAVDDLQRLEEQGRRDRGFRPAPTDLKPPFVIAAAATNQAGHKLVVFSSVQCLADAVAQASGLQQIGSALVLGQLYPANTDLFVNALHWLTGEKDRIALGPRRGDLPRLKDLSAEWAARLPVFLVGIWPAVALMIGAGVWLVRRR